MTQRSSQSDIPEETNGVSGKIVESSFRVHSVLGPGLLESVYEACLAHELAKRGVKVNRQVALPVAYDGLQFDEGFRMDMVVGGCVVVEFKAVESILPVHKAQLLTYLKLSGHRVGLLINFNVPLIKDGFTRMVL